MAPRASQEVGRWRRNLYEDTGLPDNYTPDDCFLDAIQRNRDLPRHAFAKCVCAAARVSLQMAAMALFVLAYVAMDGKRVESGAVASVCVAVTLGGYFAHQCNNSFKESSLRSVWADVKHVAVFLSFGFGLCPVLYTLTDTISTDTIHTTSGAMLALHLLFHGYGKETPQRPDALSLNAALFASVCLASRMGSSGDAFVLLVASVIAFVLFPLLCSSLSEWGTVWANALLGCCAVAAALSVTSLISALAVLAVLMFVTLVAPALFVRWQNYKDTIHGPWDEAVPKM